MKKHFLIYSLVFLSLFAKTQTKTIDSLYKVLKFTKDDTAKINVLIRLAKDLINLGSYDTSIVCYQKAIILGTKIEDKKGIASCLKNIGTIYVIKGNYFKALENYSKSLKISETLGDEKSVAATIGNIGLTYFYQGNFPEALLNNLKSLKIYEKLNDKKGVAHAAGNIGIVYFNQGDYNKALSYYFKSLKISEEIGDNQSLAAAIGNIGTVYQNSNNYEKAMEYTFKALKIYQKIGDKRNISNGLHNIGNNYSKQKDYDKALEYYLKALVISKELGDKNSIASTLNSIGAICTLQKKYSDAEINLLKALNISKEIGDLDGIQLCSQSLSELYEEQHFNDKALDYYKAFIAARDSINNKETIQKQVRVEMDFDFEKKQAMEKAEQEKKDALLEKEIKEKNYLIVAAFAAVLITVLMAWMFIYQNKLRSQQQKQELEQKLLQTQMNPHFIFNSLNSIQSYIYKNDSLNAGIYLSRFAELIRMILENSRENFVSLEKEIKGLNYYLELQQLRFENKFDYVIEVGDDIDPEIIAIPPMLAQPFIENAIEHGILYKKEKGHIVIRFKVKNNVLVFEVEDDGVGIKEAKELKTSLNRQHKSLATLITNERLAILNKRKRKKILLSIIDLKAQNIANSGTKVIFDIPYVEI